MTAYYNEHDADMAAWLRALIRAGQIADGEVDERSINDVRPDELRGFTQCHFFAGIGGWSYALRLAGWPDDRAVWTGSCPCQPFSSAGTQIGGHDPRDLWPTWYQLIRECRPAVVFGEQVATAIAHGWLDRVCDDLERSDFAIGACVLPAASVGAFHIRQRVWFVAHDDERRCAQLGAARLHADGPSGHDAIRCGTARDVGHADQSGSQGQHVYSERADQCAPWASSVVVWIPCRDGTRRAIESGSFPLAHGISARVGRLRGYGNAIVPQVAQAFIEAYLSGSESGDA